MWQNLVNGINPYFYFLTLRNFLYDRGFFRAYKVQTPVISVGNLSCGGTGKTSLVRYLAEFFSKKGPLLILSRGYRRQSKGFRWVLKKGELLAEVFEAGDEPYLLGMLFQGSPQVSVAVCERRYEGATLAEREVKPQLIILDDGFQHRALWRDLDLVLLKGKDIKDSLIPFGKLRETVNSLKRASAIVLAYQELAPFAYTFPPKPVFKMFRKTFKVLDANLRPIAPDLLPPVIAFSALGDNDQFFATLRKLGLKLKDTLSFPDHFSYQGFTLNPKEVYLTTLKDFVKLKPVENLFLLDFSIDIPDFERFLENFWNNLPKA